MSTNTVHTTAVPPIQTVVIANTSSVKPGTSTGTIPSGSVGDNAFLGLLVDGVNAKYVCPSGSNYVIAATDVGKTLFIMNAGFKNNFTTGAYPIIGVVTGTNQVQRWILGTSPAVVGSSGANWNIGVGTLPYASGAIKLPPNSNCMVPVDACQISPAHCGNATTINPGMTFHMGGSIQGKSANDDF